MVGRGEEFRGWTKVHSFSYNGIVKTCNMKTKKECEGGKVMDEYIKREDLLELYRIDDPVLNENGHVPLPVIRQNIMDIPAADVAPVRHGRWEKQSGLYSCSECGMTCPYDVQADVIEYWACNYCPKCGAKMDGGNNDACL